jgi:hypothetical protein
VIQDVNSRSNHGLHGAMIAFEVGNQDFDANSGVEGFYPENGFGKVGGAAVGEIVTIDGRDDDVLQSEIFHGQRHVARLFGIQQHRLAFADGAEAAAARADVAEN